MTLIIVFNISLFSLNLILYISLSLAPLFFLLNQDAKRFKQALRSIDENCIFESYLETGKRDQKQFMEKALNLLVEKRLVERRIPFRISRLNKLFIIVFILSLALFQTASIITFGGLTGGLYARDLKAKRINMLIVKKNDDSQFVDSDYTESIKETQAHRNAVLKETMEMRRFRGEFVQSEDLKDPSERFDKGKQSSQFPGAHLEEKDSYNLSNELFKGLKQNRSGSYSEFPGVSSEERHALYSKDQESQGIGKSFLESPLKNYSTVPETFSADGGQDLTTGFTITEDRKRLFLNALFSDIMPGPLVASEFNPLIDRIKDNYLRLIHERY